MIYSFLLASVATIIWEMVDIMDIGIPMTKKVGLFINVFVLVLQSQYVLRAYCKYQSNGDNP
jgi:hypothetical protein